MNNSFACDKNFLFRPVQTRAYGKYDLITFYRAPNFRHLVYLYNDIH
jgi:hypothetical protein